MVQFGPVPNDNSVQPMADGIPQANRESQVARGACSSLVNEIRGGTGVQVNSVRTQNSRAEQKWGLAPAEPGSFRRWCSPPTWVTATTDPIAGG
jgi:hypothetical protein